jgi:hypothetical protein
MPPGKIHSHWVTLRSHEDPAAEDVASGSVCLGTDGSTIYMTTSDGTTTPINGSAVMKDIVLDDDASEEFLVRQGTNTYLQVDTVDDAEVVRVGNEDVTALTVQIQAATIEVASSGSTMISAGDTWDALAVGAMTFQGGSINVGGAGNGDILVGSTGTREITMGNVNATGVDLVTSGASIALSSGGAVHRVSSAKSWTVGRVGVDYLVVDDDAETVSVLSTVEIDSTTVTVTGNLDVTGTVDGVDLSTLGSIANGQGCSQLGVEDPGGYYAGANVEAVLQEVGVSLGLVPANMSDLADVDTTGVADKNLLWYVVGSTEFQPATPAAVAAEVSIQDLADVDGVATPTDGQILAFNNGTGLWGPVNSPAMADLDSLSDVNAPSPADGEVLTWDAGGGEWVAAASSVTGGAGSEFEPAALSTVGVFERRSVLNQTILTSQGVRIHISFAATLVRTGAPTGEVRLGLILEDGGGSPAAYFATNADLGGGTNVEISGHITLSLGAADSEDANERNIYVSGSCLREIDGTSVHSSVRLYDSSGHAPVAFPVGLKVGNVGISFNHLRFAALTNNATHDASNKYEVTVQAVTIDMFEGA